MLYQFTTPKNNLLIDISKLKLTYAKPMNSFQTSSGVNGAGTLHEGPLLSRYPMGEQRRIRRHQKAARTGWSKKINVAVMECYFLSRPFHEKAKPIIGYRKRMHKIWKERQGLKVTEQRLSDHTKMITKNGWLIELKMIVIKIA